MHLKWGDPEAECGVSPWCSGPGSGDGGVWEKMSASTSRVVVATVLNADKIRAGQNAVLFEDLRK